MRLSCWLIRIGLVGSFVSSGCAYDAPLDPAPPDLAMGESPLPDLKDPNPINEFLATEDEAICRNHIARGLWALSSLGECIADRALARLKRAQVYSYAEAVAASRLEFDAMSAPGCLQAWPLLRMPIFADYYNGLRYTSLGPPPCDRVFRPKVDLGGTCLADFECKVGYCRAGVGRSPGCAGVCAAFEARGAACDAPAKRCAPEDFCDGRICVARLAEGAPCLGAPVPCAPGLSCDSTRETCVKRYSFGAGSPCKPGMFPLANCSPELFCDKRMMPPACAPLRTEGEECASVLACKEDFSCAGYLEGPGGLLQAGRCTRHGDVGAACTGGGQIDSCAGGTVCDKAAMRCVKLPRATAGAPCGFESDCYDNRSERALYCDLAQKKCVPLLDLGAACVPVAPDGVSPCWSGACDSMTKRCVAKCQ